MVQSRRWLVALVVVALIWLTALMVKTDLSDADFAQAGAVQPLGAFGYLAAALVTWWALAFLLGVIVGWSTWVFAPARYGDGVVALVWIAFLLLLVIAAVDVTPVRVDFWLEAALLMFFVYWLGCGLGWALRCIAMMHLHEALAGRADARRVSARGFDGTVGAGARGNEPSAQAATGARPSAEAAPAAETVMPAGAVPAPAEGPAPAATASAPPGTAGSIAASDGDERAASNRPDEAPMPAAKPRDPERPVEAPTAAQPTGPKELVPLEPSHLAATFVPAPSAPPTKAEVEPDVAASGPAPAAPGSDVAAPAPGADKHPGSQPQGLVAPRGDKPDDLKLIRGIGPQNEKRLNGLGVFHFDQIAAWTPENVLWAGSYLAFPGRIQREQWVAQAANLAADPAAGRGTPAPKRPAGRKAAT